MSAYPVKRPPDGKEDPRFTFGLQLDIQRVLEKHGYPAPASGTDHSRLLVALFHLIYGEEEGSSK